MSRARRRSAAQVRQRGQRHRRIEELRAQTAERHRDGRVADGPAVCVEEPRCDAVTFWGFTDAYSWIDGQFGPDDPLLFDEQYVAKPAFHGVLEALLRR